MKMKKGSDTRQKILSIQFIVTKLDALQTNHIFPKRKSGHKVVERKNWVNNGSTWSDFSIVTVLM